MKIALVGKPNCGKTALFNTLTGSHQKVANYAGVTVERKEGRLTLPSGEEVTLIDLPGTYSLRARSPDEVITRDVVLGAMENEPRPDMIVCVVDATSLTLNLRLVLELKKLGLPMVVALNMSDLAEQRGYRFDLDALSQSLGAPVVPTVAIHKKGVQGLIEALSAPIASAPPPEGAWHEPTALELRALNTQVDAIVANVTLSRGTPSLRTRQLDRILLHPVWGIPILLALLFVVFQAVFTWAAAPMDAINTGVALLSEAVHTHLPDTWWRSLLADGIIAGVGSVVIFLPQIILLFFFILLLEDSGYMARAAFLLDRMMGVAGLNGRAFIPLLSSFACAIPGIMATRTIHNRRDRLVTIMIAPLMTCSARLPVYALIIAAFIPARDVWGFNLQGLVMFGLYATGITAALLVASAIRLIRRQGAREPLLMELPSYKRPSLRNLGMSVLERVKLFLHRAGTVIFAMMLLIWVLSSFPAAPEGSTGPAITYSMAGSLGKALEPLLAPIGFNWQIAIALVPGMAAREVAVGALGTVYALSDTENTESLASTLATAWSLPTALAFLAWYVFAPQCASTLAVTRRETNSWRWPLLMFAYLMVLAYAAAFVTYRIALLIF